MNLELEKLQEVLDVQSMGIRKCLKKMAKNKAGDDRGVVIEMLQLGGPMLMQSVANLFTAILKEEAPEYYMFFTMYLKHANANRQLLGTERKCLLFRRQIVAFPCTDIFLLLP